MKKFFIGLIAFLSIVFPITAETYPFKDVTYLEILDTLFCFKEGVFETYFFNENYEWVTTSYSCEIKKEGAYLVANIQDKEKKQKLYIFNADKKHMVMYNATTGERITATEKKGIMDEPWIYSVFDITASSYLTETLNGKEVSYVAKNLNITNLSKSWVEGVEGFGKGEKISFTNVGAKGSRRLYIINGFFSPEKPSLFYDNNRVKTLKINCYDKNKKLVTTEFRELKDTGEMQLIEFSERYDFFDFIIEDVYPGKKYNDTAITGIFVDGLDAEYY